MVHISSWTHVAVWMLETHVLFAQKVGSNIWHTYHSHAQLSAFALELSYFFAFDCFNFPRSQTGNREKQNIFLNSKKEFSSSFKFRNCSEIDFILIQSVDWDSCCKVSDARRWKHLWIRSGSRPSAGCCVVCVSGRVFSVCCII